MKNTGLIFGLNAYEIGSVQRVIRREPKVECYVLTKVKSPQLFDHFTTNSSHFSDTYLHIFLKTEDQMVILRY